MEVTLTEMLLAREQRAAWQQELLSRYRQTLVCFTMNIAGPVKDSPRIRRGFRLGLLELENQLLAAKIPVLHRQVHTAKTGSVAFLVAEGEPLAVKARTVAIEDHTQAGRLFDMDVLTPEGRKVDRQELGLPGRRCLLCGNDAHACARSRQHTVAQLQEKTQALLEQAICQADCQTAARLACQALLYEVAVTPKPGLVDRANSGSHRDMDFFTFQASAAALWPYFAQCTRIGIQTRQLPPEDTFAQLRIPGTLAEGRMLRATGGVNTHKGAIFSLGILCGALGRLEREAWQAPEQVLAQASRMTRGLVARDYAGLTPETADTAGKQLYLRYGITGVRGQAEAGFPAVGQVGLPKLEQALAQGKSINDAGCAALIAMLAGTADTNLIHRGGYPCQQQIAKELAALLEQAPFPDGQTLLALDQAFIRQNLSPGGTADLLALVYFLHFLKEEAYE